MRLIFGRDARASRLIRAREGRRELRMSSYAQRWQVRPAFTSYDQIAHLWRERLHRIRRDIALEPGSVEFFHINSRQMLRERCGDRITPRGPPKNDDDGRAR